MIKKIKTDDGIEVLELINGTNRILVTYTFGPRICFLGKVSGKNLLYWEPEGFERNGWKLYGGHRVWITRPLADETEDTYVPDNEMCHIEYINNGVRIESPRNRNGITRGIKIIMLEDEKFCVINFIKNEGPMLYSAGIWSPTCINPEGGKKFAVSIGDDDSTWDLIKMVIPRKFTGNTILVNDDQITFNEYFMLIEPKGNIAKRCIFSAKGKIAMTWKEENLTFVKSVKVKRGGNYQSGGCNMAIFIGQDNFMVEMETYGEERSVYPYETIEHEEIWGLYDKYITFNTYDDVRDL